MKIKSTMILMAMLCLKLSLMAQVIKPIKLGDDIPQRLWNTSFDAVEGNGKRTTVKLGDYKGKLIILDFWSTFCGACMDGFEKVEEMQRKFGNQVKMILVDMEQLDKVVPVFEKKATKNGRPLELVSIYNDSLLSKFIPYQLIPHYAWISQEGVLVATTAPREINAANITRALKDKDYDMEMKVDMNKNLPLYAADYLPKEKLQHYSILIKGYIEGIGSSLLINEEKDTVSRFMCTNNSLLGLYNQYFYKKDKSFDESLVQLTVKDSSTLFPVMGSVDWYRKNAYSYDLIVPAEQGPHLYDYMLEDLNRYSPFIGGIEQEMKECLVLVPSGSKKEYVYQKGDVSYSSEKEVMHLNKVGMDLLIARLNHQLNYGLWVLDETGYTGKITIQFSGFVHNLDELNRELERNGLTLKKANRLVNQFRIRDK